jgi:hypothetical protein
LRNGHSRGFSGERKKASFWSRNAERTGTYLYFGEIPRGIFGFSLASQARTIQKPSTLFLFAVIPAGFCERGLLRHVKITSSMRRLKSSEKAASRSSDGPLLSVSEPEPEGPDEVHRALASKHDATARFTKPAMIVALIIVAIGIILLVPGLVLLATDDVEDVPYTWSIPLCESSPGVWKGMNVTTGLCPEDDLDVEQSFHVPSVYVDINAPYKPFLLVSDRGTERSEGAVLCAILMLDCCIVDGGLMVSVQVGHLTKFFSTQQLSGLTGTDFWDCRYVCAFSLITDVCSDSAVCMRWYRDAGASNRPVVEQRSVCRNGTDFDDENVTGD